MFRQFDQDGSGTVSTEEAKVMLRKLSMPDEEIELLVAMHDRNNDGELQYHEFVTFLLCSWARWTLPPDNLFFHVFIYVFLLSLTLTAPRWLRELRCILGLCGCLVSCPAFASLHFVAITRNTDDIPLPQLHGDGGETVLDSNQELPNNRSWMLRLCWHGMEVRSRWIMWVILLLRFNVQCHELQTSWTSLWIIRLYYNTHHSIYIHDNTLVKQFVEYTGSPMWHRGIRSQPELIATQTGCGKWKASSGFPLAHFDSTVGLNICNRRQSYRHTTWLM